MKSGSSFWIGWNGIVSRPFRSFSVGLGTGILLEKGFSLFGLSTPIWLMLPLIASSSVFAFFARLDSKVNKIETGTNHSSPEGGADYGAL